MVRDRVRARDTQMNIVAFASRSGFNGVEDAGVWRDGDGDATARQLDFEGLQVACGFVDVLGDEAST